jgi:endonuclease YncB( thermonuclease family)
MCSSRPLQCRSEGWGRGERTAAWCRTSAGEDLSCTMVRSGHALKWDQYWRGRQC